MKISHNVQFEFDVVQKEVRTVSFVYGIPRSFPSSGLLWLPKSINRQCKMSAPG
ncbi:hypothetical protein DAPPUDRAFT_236065 [Daphnia pulex]|uniref:Uncharacterized protein n=1 Tax=Daphnia pulex TaxID=6669 RepID=E9FZV8_DAPPU|nr:hypothetical protein DAPPUDRAFT_236065 [Daphnia pulex]|eukprot:EFX87192.1 hypothetical protein DAPPUDRAFT_236065 [Daphnia pulex]